MTQEGQFIQAFGAKSDVEGVIPEGFEQACKIVVDVAGRMYVIRRNL